MNDFRQLLRAARVDHEADAQACLAFSRRMPMSIMPKMSGSTMK
jgi:hypothetical protein